MFLNTGSVRINALKTNALAITTSIALLSNIPTASATSVGQFYSELVTGQQVSLTLLNHLKSTERYTRYPDKNVDGMYRQYEWGQSVGLFYTSGKASFSKDSTLAMSFDVGYNHMFKLADSYPGGVHNWNAGEKIFMSKDCFWTGGEPYKGQYKCNDTSGYGKLPVANVRLDWGKGQQRGFMRVGDGFYNTGMITSADLDSALLSSYRGVMAQHSQNGYIFDGGFVTGFMGGNESKMGNLTGNSNYYDPYPLTYDYLYTMRVRKNYQNSGYRAAYGEAKDFLRRSHVDVWYRHPLSSVTSVYVKGQYYYNRAAGDLWQQDVDKGQAAFDTYASAASYEFRLQYDALELMYGFTHIDAPRKNGNGSFSYGFGNAKGYLNLPTNGNYHGFRRDGMDARVVQLRYDFRNFGHPDLYVEYGYHWGEAPIIEKATGATKYGSEYEHAITLRYRPRTGALKGFVFNLQQAFHRPDDTLANIVENDPFPNRGDRTNTKLAISYMFNL
ncbi:OprD family outer membrane porin [Vibrio hangzhouensis]|uniref:Outer membrane porin, OprD family n=1 Tax=Vibrio hangzhouensis TaxID=462991 RepID=A0A1H6B9J1_9VIBR|nr:OprD family outer membrane porin [Vibrio hangzhouensis]SEG56877.1 outer membrane porin, OprD family [Vibrio hangzhouensis]